MLFENKIPIGSLKAVHTFANNALVGHRRPGTNIKGPAGAAYASLMRLGCKITNHTQWVDDSGYNWDPSTTCPKTLQTFVQHSVFRWICRHVARARHIPIDTSVFTPPIRKLLTTTKGGDWFANCRGVYRPLTVNAQWPPSRLCQEGLLDNQV